MDSETESQPEWAPEFDLPSEPDAHRPGPGWLILLSVLALFIGLQLYGYLSRTPEDVAETKIRSAETSLRLSYLTAESNRRLQIDNPSGPAAIAASVGELDDLRSKDPEAALVWAVGRVAGGRKLDPNDLALLRSAKEAKYKAAARILDSSQLGPDEVKSLTAKLPDGFAWRLIRVEAKKRAGEKHPEGQEFTAQETVMPVLMMGAFLFAGVVGVVLLVGFSSLRAAGKIHPRGHPAGQLSAADADRFAGKAGVLILAMAIVPLLLGPLLGGLPAPASSAIKAVALIVATLAIARQPIFGKRFELAKIGWKRGSAGTDALWGLGAALANVPILVVVAFVSDLAFRGLPPPEHPTTVSLSSDSSFWAVAITLLLASVMAPIVEETIFRGFLVPAMSRATGGAIGGWIVGGVAFAAIHPTGVPAWLPLAAVGAMAAAVNHQTGSIISSVVMHAVHNTAILALAIFVLG